MDSQAYEVLAAEIISTVASGVDGLRRMAEQRLSIARRIREVVDSSHATLTAALEEARGALEAFAALLARGIARDSRSMRRTGATFGMVKDSAFKKTSVYARIALATIKRSAGEGEGMNCPKCDADISGTDDDGLSPLGSCAAAISDA